MRCALQMVWLLLLSGRLFAQMGSVDSLKARLPLLNDTLRIDSYNQICYSYIALSEKDSAMAYQRKAYDGARALNYIHGIAESNLSKAAILRYFDDDFPGQERLASESLKWFAKTPNKKNIGLAYTQLAFALFAQSWYEKAIIYQEKAIEYSAEFGWPGETSGALINLANIYLEKGDYDSAFSLSQRALQQSKIDGDPVASGRALQVIARIYTLIEDYPSALEYIRWSLQQPSGAMASDKQNEFHIWPQMLLAEIYWHLHQYDSAETIYNSFDTLHANEKDLRVFYVSKGEFFLQTGRYPEAFQHFWKGLELHKKKNDRNQIMRTLIDLGKASLGEKDAKGSLRFEQDGLKLALQANSRQYMLNSYEVIFKAYAQLNQIDSAYKYQNKYLVLKDSVLNDKLKGRIAGFAYERKIANLDSENKLREQKLKDAAYQRVYFIIGAIILVFLCALIIRNAILEKKSAENKFQKEKMRAQVVSAELQNEKSELEMKVLRSQMNPHFIFNALNSINRFILKNDSAQASEYLAIFSRLIRLNLQNAQHSLIPLENELEALRLYLEIESLRFDFHFQYSIFVADEINETMIRVPPLILQPFVENAIWHGLMHKEEPGHLDIKIIQNGEHLVCRITDDGIGRNKSEVLKSKLSTRFKSLGIEISSERIKKLRKDAGINNPVIVMDLVHPNGSAAGTEVTVIIPIIYGESDTH